MLDEHPEADGAATVPESCKRQNDAQTGTVPPESETGVKHRRLKENAIATFQAPPWCPSPPVIFFFLMMTGATFPPDALISTTFQLTRNKG
jgi:hypothetical protein